MLFRSELIINSKAWASLPRDLQLIVKTSATASNLLMLSEFEAKNLEALRTLETRYKVKTREFPAKVIKTLHQYTKITLDEIAAKDKLFSKVYNAYEQFRTSNDAWNSISEAAYARARKL